MPRFPIFPRFQWPYDDSSGNTRPELELDKLKSHEQSKAARQATMKAWRHVINFTFLVVAGSISYFCALIGTHILKVPDLGFLEHYNPIQAIQVYDCRDKLICSVEGIEKRTIIPLKSVSPFMRKALLAAEDHRFYEHHGVSLIGIGRAVVANLAHGKVKEGGSTITQQLVKNLFFDGEKRSIDLKLAELYLSTKLEDRYSKDKILELYLNEVYFGNNAYGIEQAARKYFAKRAAELDVAESAYLAGIIRSPSAGGMLEYREESLARQREVIQKMVDYGFINQQVGDAARMESLHFQPPVKDEVKLQIPRYPYYVSAVIEQMKSRYSAAAIERHGMRIYTNLDPVAQDAAERALANGVHNAPYGVNQGALVSIRVSDGAVVALVGGVGNYLDNQWNCATNPHTAGSSFKPFVYLAAIERGLINENSYIDDSPMTVRQDDGNQYKPKNFDGRFLGCTTVAKAFAQSRNIPALRTAMNVGTPAVIDVATRAGIRSRLETHLAMALGSSAVTPLEMANAYATFARGGEYMTPMMVRRAETKTGCPLDLFTSDHYWVFDRSHVAQLVDLLQDVVAHGTGQLAKLPDRPVAGKTGTADQGKDLWFVGFTPDMVTSVWGGNRDNRPVGGGVTGGTIMASIWRNYNSAYYRQAKGGRSFFIASNRGPAQFAADGAPYIATTASASSAGRYSPSSGYVSYATQVARRNRAAAAARARTSVVSQAYQRSRAPSGGAIRRADHGITDYSWNRRR